MTSSLFILPRIVFNVTCDGNKINIEPECKDNDEISPYGVFLEMMYSMRKINELINKGMEVSDQDNIKESILTGLFEYVNSIATGRALSFMSDINKKKFHDDYSQLELYIHNLTKKQECLFNVMILWVEQVTITEMYRYYQLPDD